MRPQGRIIFFIAVVPYLAFSHSDEWMHPRLSPHVQKRSIFEYNEEGGAAFWRKSAQDAVRDRTARRVNTNIAKNVILFLGDGMSIPTLSAARVYLGGEEQDLSFEKFPYTGLSKTYCVDSQVADSACSATAYLTGVKANYGTIGVTANVPRTNCPPMNNVSNHVFSIARDFQLAYKRTGLVTTARVSHASPAGVYAHVAEREWENDVKVKENNYDPVQCRDIAWQLVHGTVGKELNVILGGGRSNFLPKEEGGNREDKTNLIVEWLKQKEHIGAFTEYAEDRKHLLEQVNYSNTEYLLGLFNPEHMDYNLKRNKTSQPSLAEMTEAAIKLLENSEEGYFLFVEGGRIDMAHHAAQARMALDETSEFSKAVETAVDLTKESDTLIVVTSDHAHTMSYSGYAPRRSDILGIAGNAMDKIPYTILNYANGPGYKPSSLQRYDVTKDDMTDVEYPYPGIAPLDAETHGGDDVGIFAKGPWAHLFTGVMEQNVIPHLLSYAACVGHGETACDKFEKEYHYSPHVMNLNKHRHH